MLKITAKVNTVFKKLAVDSRQLTTKQISLVFAGQVFEVTSIKTQDNHTFVELPYGMGNWWIFNDHWDISKSSSEMQLSNAGLNLIKKWEGLRLTAYLCPANILTIGYGSTGSHVKPGMKITEKQAEELLKKDLVRFEQAVNRLVKVPLTQGQYDALVSFTFNCGIQAFKSSTLLKLVNTQSFDRASLQFMRWNKGGGRILPGLTNRRREEIAMFNS